MAHFPGFPPYLAKAAEILGVADLAILTAARQPKSITRLSDLVAQASQYTHPSDVAKTPGILAEARKSRDALAVAALAAELVLSEAHATHRVEGGSPVLSPTAWEGTRAHDATPAEVEALAEVARLTGEVERLNVELAKSLADAIAANERANFEADKARGRKAK